MKSLLISIILSLFIVTGCSSINPKKLSTYNSSKILVIENDITYTGKRGLFSFQEGLRKGIYRAELKDENGIYFRGSSFCVFTTPGHDAKTREYEGGLWVPNDGDLTHSRIYSYFSAARYFAEEKPVTGVTVINAQGVGTSIPGVLTLPVYFDDGNLHLWDKDVGSEFSSNIKWQEK